MMYIYPWQLIGPCPHDIKTGHNLTRTSSTDGIGGGVHCWMNYLYFYTVINPLAALSLPFPNVPTLYIIYECVTSYTSALHHVRVQSATIFN